MHADALFATVLCYLQPVFHRVDAVELVVDAVGVFQIGDLRAVPIGTPMANVCALCLDSKLAPTPTGVPGELHFGGANTARGCQEPSSPV